MPRVASANPKKTGTSLTRKVVVFLVISAVGAAVFWLWRGRETATASAHSGSVLHLETFVLNLNDADQRAYLRVGVDLGLSRSPNRNESEAPPPIALLRDTVLTVLASEKTADLLQDEGKRKLKESLVRALRDRAPEMGIEEVYFTEFLIQR